MMTESIDNPEQQQSNDFDNQSSVETQTDAPSDARSETTVAVHIRSHGRLRSEQQWEVVREVLHPLIMQRTPGVAIAEIFGVSVDTVYRWRKRLYRDLRQEAVTIQPRDFIMESISSLRKARAEAWKQYFAATTERDKRAYLQLVIQTENQYGKLGANIGLFGGRDDRPMEPNTYNENQDDPAAQSALFLRNMMVEVFTEPEDKRALSDNSNEQEEFEDLLAELRPTEALDCVNKFERAENARPAPALQRIRKRRRPIA